MHSFLAGDTKDVDIFLMHIVIFFIAFSWKKLLLWIKGVGTSFGACVKCIIQDKVNDGFTDTYGMVPHCKDKKKLDEFK